MKTQTVFLAAALFLTSLVFTKASTLEVWRNGTPYTINLQVANGGTFTRRGVDRFFTIPGSSISGSFRLIQDNYSECGQLIRERRASHAKKGFTKVLANHETAKQCAVTLSNPSAQLEMTSYYTRLEACKCFSAIHFIYSEQDALHFQAAGRAMVMQLASLARAQKQENGTGSFDALDPAWKEGIRILHKRGFSPEMASAIQLNFFGDALAMGIVDDPRQPSGDQGFDYIASVYGLQKQSGEKWDFVQRFKETVPAPDLIFDVVTGKQYWKKGVSPQEMAGSISSCYKTVRYESQCKLNYHSQQGCRMTSAWQRFCRKTATDKTFAQYGDLCFWTPKGDLPMLPVGEFSEKAILLPATGKIRKQKPGQASHDAPMCEDSQLADYAGEY